MAVSAPTGECIMARNEAVHPRWVLRRDERRNGRYGGDKVVRWIARPTLMRGRSKSAAVLNGENDPAPDGEWPRPASFGGLRIVSKN